MTYSAAPDRSHLLATGLPALEVLPQLSAALEAGRNAVLVAPPGAGKTTLAAPWILDEAWLAGQKIWVMLPRRLAARAAAERIAGLLGEKPGGRVGYRTRLESKPGTRIECLTEGLFVNRLLADPGLEGVGALLFDEVHERNLDGDLGLALALDAQQLRDDLRIVAMSATVDGARFAQLMDGAAVLESAGRTHPVEVRYLGRSEARIEDRMASALHQALAQTDGNILAFLPGVGEIERVAERVNVPAGAVLHKLHGQADPAAQRAAILPEAARKIVLSTAIAETSLTIDGVKVVIDSGLARRPRYDRASGLTKLVTERVSQAAAEQRAGRAGRQAPGVAMRLWDEGGTRGLIPYDPPEIVEADLAPLLLRLAAWGVRDPAELRWLDPPSASAVAAARSDLQMLGAFDADGQLNAHGKRMGALPVSPRMANLLLQGAMHGQAETAALLALLLEERGLGGRSVDLDERLRHLARDRGRSAQGRKLAERWAAMAQQLVGGAVAEPVSTGYLLAMAFPDRVAKLRRAPGASDALAEFLMVNGRGVALETTEPLARQGWIVVADAGGAGASARVRLAASLEGAELNDYLQGRTQTTETLAPDPASGRLALIRTQKLGAIEVGRTRAPASKAQVAEALLAEVRAKGLDSLPWSEAEAGYLARMRFAQANGCADLPDVSDAGLLAEGELWLLPRLQNVSRLKDVRLDGALADWLDWNARQALDAFAPSKFHSPAGTSHSIDYAAEGGPEVEVRVQAVFGLAQHPMLGRKTIPLTLALTSPAGRPVAKTRDLPAFWKGAWRDVQKDMKGRYPKHPWPDDPASAAATVRTKAADARRAQKGD